MQCIVSFLLLASAAWAQEVKIVFFTPSDLAVPAGARERLTKIAEAAERFLFDGMRALGYPPEISRLVRREPDGLVEMLEVKGEQTSASGKYARPDYADYVKRLAIAKYHLAGSGIAWWIFIYLGDRPVRFADWQGGGDPLHGGWAMVNYDTVPGEIRPDLHFTEGFNYEYKLKSTVHELGHALGLPHMGPDPEQGVGNSLMGPNPPGYDARRGPNRERVYMARSEAAMLWKHPIFTGRPLTEPALKSLDMKADTKAEYRATEDSFVVTGTLTGKTAAHSVVVIDDRGEKDRYWVRSYATWVGEDGRFEVKVNGPAKVDGQLEIYFCFDNGWVTLDHRIKRAYKYQDGEFRFGG